MENDGVDTGKYLKPNETVTQLILMVLLNVRVAGRRENKMALDRYLLQRLPDDRKNESLVTCVRVVAEEAIDLLYSKKTTYNRERVPWSNEEKETLAAALKREGNGLICWQRVSSYVGTRTEKACMREFAGLNNNNNARKRKHNNELTHVVNNNSRKRNHNNELPHVEKHIANLVPEYESPDGCVTRLIVKNLMNVPLSEREDKVALDDYLLSQLPANFRDRSLVTCVRFITEVTFDMEMGEPIYMRYCAWSSDEKEMLAYVVKLERPPPDINWVRVARYVKNRTDNSCRIEFERSQENGNERNVE